MVAPSTRVNIAFPFSTMRVEEATQELAELATVIVDLLSRLENLLPDNADALEALRVRAEAVAGRLR
jgi:hypothetical protein